MLGEQNAQLQQQITCLEWKIENKQVEDDRLHKAYLAGVFDEHECAARRAIFKDEHVRLNDALETLRPQIDTREQFEAQKEMILDRAERIRSVHPHLDPPFEIKQRIIKMTVNRILLNTHMQTIRLEGGISGVNSIGSVPAMRYTIVNRSV